MEVQKKIFLSHKGSDKPTVTDFKKTLEEFGYEPWLDEDAMPAGTPSERGLLQGMRDSCAVVFFVTPSFADEGYLATEIEYAIGEKRRKGDRFAIISLRLKGSDGHLAPIPELLKRYTWKEPTTSLDALREIIRALPIAASSIEWRDGLPGHTMQPGLKVQTSELSSEAKAILKEAVIGDGSIIRTRTLGGQSITTNGRSMIPDKEPRTIARWVGALEDLLGYGYVKELGHQGEVFEVTREGYEAVDQMSDG